MTASPTPSPVVPATPEPSLPALPDSSRLAEEANAIAAVDVAVQALIAALTLAALIWAILSSRRADARAASAELKLDAERRKMDEQDIQRAVLDAVSQSVAVLTNERTQQYLDLLLLPSMAPRAMQSKLPALREAYYGLMGVVLNAAAIAQASGHPERVRADLERVAGETVREVTELVEAFYSAIHAGWSSIDFETLTLSAELDERRYNAFRRAAATVGEAIPDFRSGGAQRTAALGAERVENLTKTYLWSQGKRFPPSDAATD